MHHKISFVTNFENKIYDCFFPGHKDLEFATKEILKIKIKN